MLQRHLGPFSSATFLVFALILSLAQSQITATENSFGSTIRANDPLHIDWSPAPEAEDGPSFSAGALRDEKYLPVEIGGIFAAYGVSLVLVAVTLLSLAKKRRQHLQAGQDDLEIDKPKYIYGVESPTSGAISPYLHCPAPRASGQAFPYPPPLRTQFDDSSLPPHAPYIYPSPTSIVTAPGVDPAVDPAVVSADREMAQDQLEAMYKHVMEHEDAKQRGVVLDAPVIPGIGERHSSSDKSVTSLSERGRAKPANLSLGAACGDKAHSRTSSLLAALRSPRKKQPKGVNISSPIMTPQSATFPRHEPQEMSVIPPRTYAPAPPPPIPTDQVPFVAQVRNSVAPSAPNMSPQSVQTIDERINAQLGPSGNSKSASRAISDVDPTSATSELAQTPLVGLPSSPKPGATFALLPTSPKLGATFSRTNLPSAVRTGGNLPLRAYEPAPSSPSATSQATKQTVFERRGPLSPTTGRTPVTAWAVPYSPYQPFTPVVPITPSLVTKEDRKRMRRMVPKTPTLEMVKNSDELW